MRMEHKDGRDGFDHSGIYGGILPTESTECIGRDGRRSRVEFKAMDARTLIRERFQPDPEIDLGMQQNFTDAVLLRFKAFVEAN